mgnify:FL=1
MRINENTALVEEKTSIIKKDKIVDAKKPIENWWSLINTNDSTEEINESFINR